MERDLNNSREFAVFGARLRWKLMILPQPGWQCQLEQSMEEDVTINCSHFNPSCAISEIELGFRTASIVVMNPSGNQIHGQGSKTNPPRNTKGQA